MRLDKLPQSDRIEDRRGAGSGISMSRAGGLGIGTVVVLGLIGWALGINPLLLIGGAEKLSGSGGTQDVQPVPGDTEPGSPSDRGFVSAVLGSTEVQWKEIFAQAGKSYPAPTLVMFSGVTRSACGVAAGWPSRRWAPSTVLMTRRSISTPPSSGTLRGASEAAISAARAVNSRRLT